MIWWQQVLTWEYQKADQSFARIQGNELAMHLEDILSAFDVEAHPRHYTAALYPQL